MDPSIMGRWEHTPTVMPILDRLSQIEDDTGEFVEVSQITPSDLIPEVSEYRIAPGDSMRITIRDFPSVGLSEPFEVTIDQRGYITPDLPFLPPIRLDGLTTSEARIEIARSLEQSNIQSDAEVAVQLLSQRQLTYSVMGAVVNPGSYFIPEADFRLLEAITNAGGINEGLENLYVIRQVALSEAARGRTPVQQDRPQPEPAQNDDFEDILDVIEQLGEEEQGGNPGIYGSVMQPDNGNNDAGVGGIELPDSTAPAPDDVRVQEDAPAEWRWENGRWVRAGSGTGVAGSRVMEDLVTQRVIEVPLKPLLAGAADVNIVVRPGDIIRVPPPSQGLVYMSGQVNRPGPYGIPADGKLTLVRSIDAAGGLSGLAIPERVDLMRMLPGDRQATIRLNLRAISEQTQPDLYLKPGDRINVGTNFFAFPLAVIRGGFRASYGFGFLLDRNFGNDVFGAPPTDERF